MKLRRRQITLSDLKEVAKLVGTRKLTIAEACHVRDLNPDQFYRFTSRSGRKEVFAKYVEKLKSVKINNLLEQIEEITDGNEAIKQKPDWRGKQWLLSVTDERYGKSSEPVQQTNNLTVNLMSDALKRVFVESEPLKQIAPVSRIPARKQG